MKKITLLLGLLFILNCAIKPIVNENQITINTKTKTKVENNLELKIEKIFSDSRCPINVDCIRSGEVDLKITVFKNKTIEKSESLKIDSRNFEQNKTFFKPYISETKNIKSIFISPSKIQGKNIEFEDYVLNIVLD